MTYSLGVTGTRADYTPSQPNNLTLSDDSARQGSQQSAMSEGSRVLCKGPDGAEAYYTIDAERTIPGFQTVLRAVGP